MSMIKTSLEGQEAYAEAKGPTIITNHQWRETILGVDLTQEEAREFDWMDPLERDFDTFFRYRGTVYRLGDFMRTSGAMGVDLREWDGYLSDSYFSGVLIKISSDCEQVKVGLYLS